MLRCCDGGECLPTLYWLGQRIANVTNVGTLELDDLVNAGVLELYEAPEIVTHSSVFQSSIWRASHPTMNVGRAMLDAIR